ARRLPRPRRRACSGEGSGDRLGGVQGRGGGSRGRRDSLVAPASDSSAATRAIGSLFKRTTFTRSLKGRSATETGPKRALCLRKRGEVQAVLWVRDQGGERSTGSFTSAASARWLIAPRRFVPATTCPAARVKLPRTLSVLERGVFPWR